MLPLMLTLKMILGISKSKLFLTLPINFFVCYNKIWNKALKVVNVFFYIFVSFFFLVK